MQTAHVQKQARFARNLQPQRNLTPKTANNHARAKARHATARASERCDAEERRLPRRPRLEQRRLLLVHPGAFRARPAQQPVGAPPAGGV